MRNNIPQPVDIKTIAKKIGQRFKNNHNNKRCGKNINGNINDMTHFTNNTGFSSESHYLHEEW